MKRQIKKLTLNRETLRDLTAPNAGEVKGGGKTNGKNCVPITSVTCGAGVCFTLRCGV
jgi:hypothetical protein